VGGVNAKATGTLPFLGVVKAGKYTYNIEYETQLVLGRYFFYASGGAKIWKKHRF
jgi:hypothetical protein